MDESLDQMIKTDGATSVIIGVSIIVQLVTMMMAAKRNEGEKSYFYMSLIMLFVSCFITYYHIGLEKITLSFKVVTNHTFPRFEPPIIRNPGEEPFEWTHILRENRDDILDELEQFLTAHPSTLDDLQVHFIC